MKIILEFLFVLVNPKYWLMFPKYNKEMDMWLLNAMKHYPIEDARRYKYSNTLHEIKIDGKILWITNYPYNCFTYRAVRQELFNIEMTEDYHEAIRPSCYTIYKFNKLITKWLKANGLCRG